VQVEYLTKDGLQKLKDELHECKFKKRPVVSQKVATAREHGDLKENAEYHAAREELSMLETKIQILQDRISRARIIDTAEIPDDKVYLLTSVVLKDHDFDEIIEYQLVSPSEADVTKNKISTTSPIGKALMGKTKGEKVDITVPAGVLHYEILDIKKPG
jgi:transcription elongation factor GreA